MGVREIVFYKTKTGGCPVEKFLDSLSPKHVRKIAWVLQIVEEFQVVPVKYLKKLTGTNGIWEVRVDVGGDTFRILVFFDRGNLVVLTNGFAKKTNKIPQSEISVAESRMRDWLERKK